jgi:hypothetical protein
MLKQPLIRFLDDVCEIERECGRGSTVIYIPHTYDEPIVIAINGKPVGTISLKEAINLAFFERDRSSSKPVSCVETEKEVK